MILFVKMGKKTNSGAFKRTKFRKTIFTKFKGVKNSKSEPKKLSCLFTFKFFILLIVQYCEETFLNDEEGWREEAQGVIKDIDKYVKVRKLFI